MSLVRVLATADFDAYFTMVHAPLDDLLVYLSVRAINHASR